ncbi:hypothetical protein HKX48_005305 [Thoreauomyces humboldtii]|nr:hypothetical protein HKX48_005305 [Thoreauomyces humboldtii]
MPDDRQHGGPTFSRVTHVNTTTHKLIDSDSRERIFHAVNVVYKKPPYHPPFDRFDPIDSFTTEDARILASLNVNCIRLGVHWAGAEPIKGTFDETYFDAIRRIVRTCREYRISVLLEFHQDGFSRRFCGHGCPDWVGEGWLSERWWTRWMRFPVPLRWRAIPVDENGIPDPEKAKGLTWYLLYLTFAVSDAFGKLYANRDGTLDAFAAFWNRVVSEFKEEDNVIGYEIMNEPWVGNHWTDPWLLLPGRASGTTLHVMHDRVAQAMREADPECIVYFEGATWDRRSHAPCVPGGDSFSHRSVLAYHHYIPPQRDPVATVISRRLQDAQRLKCGLFMTEWEMWHGDGSPSRISSMWNTVEACDEHHQSWAGWAYKSFAQGKGSTDGSLFDDVTGERREAFERLWSRTYPWAVAGTLLDMKFDRETAGFVMSYEVGKGGGITEIGLSVPVWYPDGFSVMITPDTEGITWSSVDTAFVSVFASAEMQGRRVTVQIDRSQGT